MSFDAGALLFKIQTVGAQVFRRDQADAEQAIEKTGKAAKTASEQVEELGKSTDETSKKSKQSKAPLTEQSTATETLAQKTARLKKEQVEQARIAREQAEAASYLSTRLIAVGAAAAAVVTLSVAKYAEFGSQMSNVQAATMATADEQKALGDAALDAGADTSYSATEAAAAEEELAKAGQNVADIVGGSLNASLALAAAGQLQVARSAEIMATAMTQFTIPADEAAHVSDVLAAGAGKAQGSVDDLALALSYVGPLANQAGWSIDETSGSLAYFASQGILGEKAGTSLRGVLAALQAPSTVAAKTMEQYGLSIYDANGNMLSAAEIAGQLQTSFGHLSQEERNAAMGRIFGNESLVAANLLYAGGSEKINEWTDAVSDSGYAARQAAMRQDNLAGDIEKLGGAFDTALIKSGSAANDVLRGMVQAVTEMVDMFGEAPEPVQATALVLGVAAAAMLLFAGGAVKGRAAFLELKTQLDVTNTSMRSTALLGGAVGIALTGVITIVGLLMAKQAEAEQKAQSYADTLEKGTQKITKATQDMIAENLTAENSFAWLSLGSYADNAETLGLSLDTVTEAISGNAEAIAEVNAAIEKGLAEGTTKAMKDADLEAYDAAVQLQQGIEGEIGSLEKAEKIAQQKAEATDVGTVATENATDAYIAEADSVEDLNSQMQQLIDRINEANGISQDAISANADWQAALESLGAQVEENGTSLNRAEAAGSANAAALADVAAAAQDAAKAQFEQDQTMMSADEATQKYIDTLASQRQAFIDSAAEAGYNRDEVTLLADEIFRLPSEKEIAIIADTAAAQQNVDSFVTNTNGRRVTIYVDAASGQQSWDVGGKTVSGTDFADGGVVKFFAGGGVEHHVAQIARGGDVRVWAEPETQGESYIPHAASKRGRSDAIMAETARILGGTYIPAGARSFADGATMAAPAAPGGTTVVEVREKGRIGLLDFIEVTAKAPTDELGFEVGGL